MRDSSRCMQEWQRQPAVRAVEKGAWGEMVALQSPHIVTVPITEVLKELKRVDPLHDIVRTAREMGISMGD